MTALATRADTPSMMAARRNEQQILDTLARLGETPQRSLVDHARVAHGSIAKVCARLETAERIIGRLVASGQGGAPRKVWRLVGQPAKDSYRGSVCLDAMPQHWTKKRRQAEREEKDALNGGRTLRERVLAALTDAPVGLCMADLVAAVRVDEPAAAVAQKVRDMWQDNELHRRRNGGFAAGPSAWRALDLADEDTA